MILIGVQFQFRGDNNHASFKLPVKDAPPYMKISPVGKTTTQGDIRGAGIERDPADPVSDTDVMGTIAGEVVLCVTIELIRNPWSKLWHDVTPPLVMLIPLQPPMTNVALSEGRNAKIGCTRFMPGCGIAESGIGGVIGELITADQVHVSRTDLVSRMSNSGDTEKSPTAGAVVGVVFAVRLNCSPPRNTTCPVFESRVTPIFVRLVLGNAIETAVDGK